MAQIIQRGAGWYSDFRQGRRRIRRFLSKDKREAQILLGKLLERVRGSGVSRDITWAAFKIRYMEYSLGSKKPASAKRDAAAIASLDNTLPITALRQLTPELLERLRGLRLKSGTGAPTLNRDMAALKAVAHKAEAWGYMDKQDWGSVRPLKQTRKRLYFHTPEELGRLLARCRGVWRTICLLGARAGLRREEIRMLAWDDVDFARGRLHVRPKDGWNPKDYEQRIIPLAADLRFYLEQLPRASRWVLGEDRPSLAIMSAYFATLSRKTKLKGSIHILRHTFASHLVQAGVPLKNVKDLLGHSSMATTEIYAELAPENLEQDVARLPVIPGSGAGSGQSV